MHIIRVFANNIETNAKQLILYSYYYSFRAFQVPEKSDIINAASFENVYNRRNNPPEEEIKKKLSDHRSKGMVVTAKTSNMMSTFLSKAESEIEKMTILSMNEVQSSADRKKYALYRKAFFIKVYNHFGTAVE
jgi:hypothetical protein